MLLLAVRDVRWLRTAVAIFAGTPTLVLWSLQPLKEGLAFAAIAALVLLLAYVGRAVTGALPWNLRNVTQGIAAAVAAAFVFWFLAGIRWYVPAVLVAAAVAVALLMMMLRSRPGLIAGIVLLVGIVVAVEGVGARKTSGGLPGRPGQGTFGAAWYVGAVLEANRQALNAPEARTRSRLGHAWQNAGAEPNGPAQVFPVAAGAWFLPPWLGERVGLLTAEGTAATSALAFIEALIFDAAVILAVWVRLSQRAHGTATTCSGSRSSARWRSRSPSHMRSRTSAQSFVTAEWFSCFASSRSAAPDSRGPVPAAGGRSRAVIVKGPGGGSFSRPSARKRLGLPLANSEAELGV